jgi:hypothetical protein
VIEPVVIATLKATFRQQVSVGMISVFDRNAEVSHIPIEDFQIMVINDAVIIVLPFHLCH